MKALSYLILIPTDPIYVPTEEQAETGADALEALMPAAEEVTYDMFDDVRFIDGGQAFEAITCPLCGKDAQAWWHNAMDKAAEAEFEELECTATCCGGQTSLNALIYQPAAAFTRFTLVATNAGVGGLNETDLTAIGVPLGCKLRVVTQSI
ncbi:hypothetical protein [Candidatus Phycosocius spiralis]|uniref:Uncharacterized protein n=1 Tax=Candidatus Phycosocius spiralis TaxID=2815099 RepID=A0ABQ4PWC1_9PROT|nr:hypothetical protein [Candidatus Phycosocius spiralis]GIU67352.1 hypothetical protein PsB1_1506 [Candidatus Phycosocius spiralis]